MAFFPESCMNRKENGCWQYAIITIYTNTANVNSYAEFTGLSSAIFRNEIPDTMKVSRQKSFAVFAVFCMSAKLFNMKVQDGAVQISIYEKACSTKLFCEDLRVELATKLLW